MNQTYVASLLLSRLATHRVGHTGTTSTAGQAVSSKGFDASARLRQREEHLHEDQLRESRSRSRVDRFADKSLHRGHDAVAQGQFVALDQRTEPRRGQVRLGTRVWSVLGFGVRRCRSVRLHRQSGRTSSEARLCRRIETVRRTLWAGVAKGQGMKLLKQFHSPRAANTPLKRGVNERAARTGAVHLINTRFQPGVAERQSEETVLTVSQIEN